MKLTTLTLCSCLAVLGFAAQASVTPTVDSSTTTSQTSWSGSPPDFFNNPNGTTSVDGGFSDGLIFDSTTSFTLGAVDFYGYVTGGGTGTYSLALYNLGAPFTIPGGGSAAVYTFTGSEPQLLTGGLQVTLTTPNNPGQFNLLTFGGADNVSIAANTDYALVFTTVSGGNLTFDRGAGSSSYPNLAFEDLTENSTVEGANGDILDNVPAGQRQPIAAIYAVAPAPEPATLAVLGLGGLASAFMVRRRKA
ncbi:MAG TPA: PEP-CTERM sorting domain-containing protein [Verrucomicrobiae bacterium]